MLELRLSARRTIRHRRLLIAAGCFIALLTNTDGDRGGRAFGAEPPAGHSTAAATHDELHSTSAHTIRVTRDFLQAGEISPMQYGQFVEYLCNLVPSMWAEKLYDGSFEGLTTYNVAFIKETDFRERPWHPAGATARADYQRDPTAPISGKLCQKISVIEGPPCTVGIAQDGIAVERGVACTFACWFKQDRINGPVRVELRSAAKELAAAEFSLAAKWKKFTARLVPAATATDATLTISFRGAGTLWLDNASLMPDDAIGGWRRDVVEAVKGLHPGVIRFGGSALDSAGYGEFDWTNTIGDPDRRKPFRAWGGLQPTGPGLAEIVDFCRLVNAEPLICLRTAGRSPADAADEVQYFNGSTNSPMGRLRANHGHPSPYKVKFWQIGNERSGADYERQLAEFCQAIRGVDASAQILASYPTPGVLKEASQWIGFVCPHQYDCAGLTACQRELSDTVAMCNQFAPGRGIKIGVTEWNTTAGDWGPHRAKLWTLENALACSRYHNLLHRSCDAVQIANRSNLANSFCSGVIQTDNHRLYKTPTYYAQQLYATLAGNRPLRIAPSWRADELPDISATLSADGKSIVLFAINSSLTDLSRTLDLTAFGNDARDVETCTLRDRKQAGEPDAVNNFDEPERVAPENARIRASSGRFFYRFPALTLTVLRIPVQRQEMK
jgi:alpha-N-arabinofuranosidase